MTAQELIHQKQMDSEPPKHMQATDVLDAHLTLDTIVAECMKRDVNPADAIANFFKTDMEKYGLNGRERFAAEREIAKLALEAWKISQPKEQVKTPSKIQIEWE